MIRLTVMYNLPPGTDEREFLEWRLNEHQASTLGMPGVVRVDFSRVDEGWPQSADPPFRFVTTADWPDWESFRSGFYDAEVQSKLKRDVERIRDAVFLVSEVLIDQAKEVDKA